MSASKPRRLLLRVSSLYYLYFAQTLVFESIVIDREDDDTLVKSACGVYKRDVRGVFRATRRIIENNRRTLRREFAIALRGRTKSPSGKGEKFQSCFTKARTLSSAVTIDMSVVTKRKSKTLIMHIQLLTCDVSAWRAKLLHRIRILPISFGTCSG